MSNIVLRIHSGVSERAELFVSASLLGLSTFAFASSSFCLGCTRHHSGGEENARAKTES